MKTRIPFAVVITTLLFWSCDDPISYDNASFVYNPFSFTEDTLYSVTATEAKAADIEWGSSFRAWVGETQYYKSGFTVEFVFSDSSLDLANVDSIQLQLIHYLTYPEDGGDTLTATYSNFGIYETMDQAIDIENSFYGNILGTDSKNISQLDTSRYTLPAGVIAEGDTIVSLGVFPAEAGNLSSFFGGGSGSRPSLYFFFHEPDTAGLDSATKIEYDADTLFMHIIEKPGIFDRTQFDYINQLKKDSLKMTVDLQGFTFGGDTIQHILSSSILPAIDDMASSLYSVDSVYRFSMIVEDPNSGLSTTIEYGGAGGFNTNEIKTLIQSAIDDKEDTIELVLRPTNAGFNPGFIAISKNVSASALYVHSSLAVKP
ncbi:MAG: hypothetical protein HQ506_12385 [Candidatus Marinimicrobia bacterium]|nr:hypothetical protein [Candidatus Neomarinimicrobiota bacterium]